MWINTEDVKSRWLNGEVPATDTQIEGLIADAEDIITSAVPDLTVRIDDGSLPISRVIRIGVQAIHRKLQNPQGMRSSMEVAGAFTVQKSYGGTEPGSMYLTADELNELRADKGKRKAFSVKMIGG